MRKTPLITVILNSTLLIIGLFSWVQAEAPPADMVLIPAGEFIMGVSPDQLADICAAMECMPKHIANATPQRKINLPAYYIDKYEVTNEQYKKFTDATGHKTPEYWGGKNFPAGKGKHPVVFVTWHDAAAYAKWAGKRLPSEAEWEKAARGTDGRLFPWGEKFNRRAANIGDKSSTTAVGKFEKGKSPYGVYDMAGNVWEWTSDNYLPYPGTTHEDEFFGKERFVLRGGSYMDLKADGLTIMRSKFTPQTDDENVGFRCVKDAK